jgi:hypothetical protein
MNCESGKLFALENDDTFFPPISQIFAQISVIFEFQKIENHRNLRKNSRNRREKSFA